MISNSTDVQNIYEMLKLCLNTIQDVSVKLDSLMRRLEDANVSRQYQWEDSTEICELNGHVWHLGPEADVELTWEEAKAWCRSIGGELPPREVLLMCYINEDIKPSFKTSWYWSSVEVSAANAWKQDFGNGTQGTTSKNNNRLRASGPQSPYLTIYL